MKSVHERLKELSLSPGAPLLLIPQGGLGLLPLHAVWREVDGESRAFLDDWSVTYAPSGYVQSVSQRRLVEEGRHGQTLLAVVNPTKDLQWTPAEGEALAALFGEAATALKGESATKEAVIDAAGGQNYLHFSCHGFYHWGEAMRSGLVLAGGEHLTLAEIISRMNLGAARLVTLSACETGLTEFRQSPDEYLGLPAGFLQAGAPAAVSTLWAVDDLSTMLLMERFYRLHIQEGLEISPALREAQLWLRDVTARELRERFTEERLKLIGVRMAPDAVLHGYERFVAMEDDARPFAHPYYWAAFTFAGA
jgi:CHAT domain-containing protein